MDAEQIARALKGKRSGNQWKCRCPAHPDKDPSMIVFDGRNAVQVRCYAGCDPLDIIAALRTMGLWEGSGNGHDVQEVQRRIETPRTDPSHHGKLALQIWADAVDPRETLVEKYLHERGLRLPSSVCVTSIRYSPECPKGNHTAPALVALMRNVESFAPQAIQRLFLAVDDDGHCFKTEGMMLGPVGNAAMMISQRAETFTDCLSFCPLLYVCEGLETALAVHQCGRRPVWALGSAGAIARFPVLFGVGELTILADNDETSDGNVGLEAAVECAERWNTGKDQHFAHIVMPRKPGTDFADAFINRK